MIVKVIGLSILRCLLLDSKTVRDIVTDYSVLSRLLFDTTIKDIVNTACRTNFHKFNHIQIRSMND